MAITINVNLDEILAALKNDLDFTGNADKYIKVNATADGFEFAAVSGGGTWGSITGTLSDQTDLQTALDAKVPYTGATTNVNLGEFGVNSGYLQFDLTPTNTPTSQGTAYWDDAAETVALIMNGTTQKVGEDTFYHVKNSTGSLIAKGTAVMFAGTDGASGKLLITPFLADGTYPSSYFMGVTAEAIANGANGKVYHFGKMRSINTSVYNDGDILYASTTSAGGFQTTKPSAPNNVISVAAVVNAGNNGTLMIRPIIEDSPTLDDVTTAGNTTTNSISVGRLTVDTDTLVVDATNNRVGIGTATPSVSLQVLGETRINNTFRVLTSTNNNIALISNAYLAISRQSIFGTVATPSAWLDVRIQSTSQVGQIIQAAAGQTANLLEVKNSGGTNLFHITASGGIATNGNAGFTGTGSYTNFTIENGIITAAS